MRKRSIIIFLISFLIGFFRTPKRQKQATHVDPLFLPALGILKMPTTGDTNLKWVPTSS
ncbi:hypothetical protein [Lentilactobacillus farraginis]|uniref:Uncharacterized protein n=1 Tax=Lentilactobacillus farraginis DSM 18382 = JCM 14108 TaxID=1423743 RepID=X0QCT0_9LACO|nr:hypothetical protein [Lentilactobacillus farraginis]GAF36420.1 hypothetical protein JCM14108_1387 [Lentilactobacillus farraginis DSM 18382 = JCM 14108]